MPETNLEQQADQAPHTLTDPVASAPLAVTEDELRAVRRSMRFLSRGNPSRRLAETVLAGERPDPELVQAVLARMKPLRATRFVEQELPAIRARARRAEDAALLLRPASAPTDTLLRPAGPPQGDPDLLLRPSQGPDGEPETTDAPR